MPRVSGARNGAPCQLPGLLPVRMAGNLAGQVLAQVPLAASLQVPLPASRHASHQVNRQAGCPTPFRTRWRGRRWLVWGQLTGKMGIPGCSRPLLLTHHP